MTIQPFAIGLLFLIPQFAPKQQPAQNLELQSRLVEMGREDQKHRSELSELAEKVNGPEKEKLLPRFIQLAEIQDAIDKKLVAELEVIIEEHGWPTISQVGKEASASAFLIIQHADLELQKKYFPLLKKAAGANDARKSDVAMLEDRILMREGKKQIYGSQLRTNSDTGKLELHPIEDEKNVDRRRASVDLPPLKEYLKHFKLEYLPPN